MLEPKLRFKDYVDEWFPTNLREYSELITKGTTPPKFYDSGIRFIRIESLSNNTVINANCLYIDDHTHTTTLRRSILKENDILFAIAGATIGKCGIVQNGNLPANTNQALSIIRLNNKINRNFVVNILTSAKMREYISLNISVGAQPNLNLEQIGNFRFNLPSISEQEKISNFLSLLDKKIKLQQEKIDALKLYKSYLVNSLVTGDIRFRKFNSKWRKLNLKDVLIKWNKKNKNNEIQLVESVSNKHGFIPQNEQFEDRIVASGDKSNYYIIEKNVFAYNPSRLNVGSLALKKNNIISVVSPLYECFITKEDNLYMLEWFNSNEFKKETYNRFEGGVRNTLNFSNLITIPVNLPDEQEQNYISNTLTAFSLKIEEETSYLEKLIIIKKGLMQDMFV